MHVLKAQKGSRFHIIEVSRYFILVNKSITATRPLSMNQPII